ncbi:hypothetical protein KP509_28G017400 [Ceratopteris richardii]|uniref:Uncharacterized protein n=1 Tax=Ceratopteris richardii TaxID=49495 RepID=A0A8T2RBR2_CERRI|nr:hypothetical protein KP509_28G017400 [Ceratopteris richardii]KAH7293242.1 hypothetical protein KP509_28G017400 [Ceratopteris richardii]KAH7293243.1 hypothetical protein KP509_28G017400 [Ceratopteris richardii]KAH7293244.1 hypothetical protein KP509_28G017400 [Ceratopteris richardii]KAH7293245.1 hypothetical protein KP509_28G017400 [Ceratopteris richardii]
MLCCVRSMQLHDMTAMESTVGCRGAHPFGYVPEFFSNTFAGTRHVQPHHPIGWFSYLTSCRRHVEVPIDGFHGSSSLRKSISVDHVAPSVKASTVIALPECVEQACCEKTTEIALESSIGAPFIGPLSEPRFSKAHPSKRRFFPSDGFSIVTDAVDSASPESPSLASTPGKHAMNDGEEPSSAVIMCLVCLELKGSHLGKCLKHASRVVEDDLIALLKTLSAYGFQRSDIKAMFSKYPSLVKVQHVEASDCIEYFSTLGFSKTTITSLLRKRPALLACDLKRASQVIEYFLSIGASKDDLISMISCRPHVLEHDVQVTSSITNALLRSNLTQSDIRKLIKRAPSVFTGSIEDINRSIHFWTSIGVEGKFLCRAIVRRPNLLNYNTDTMTRTYRYLQRWFEPQSLTKLLFRFAEVLAYDPELKLEPLINYFSELGLSEREIARVILRRPQLMSCSVKRLRKVTEFLLSQGVKEHMVGKVLVASPQVFSLNTEDKLKRGVDFFRSVGLDKERDMEFIFSRSAQLFCCSIEKNLLPTFEFFSSIGLEKESLLTMITTFPSMMGQNVELSLEPKYDFLIEEMKRTNQELVEFPQYFGYSLERRIKPRHKLLAERGLHKSLPSMLACTDNNFYKRYVEPYSPLPHPASGTQECAGQKTIKKSNNRHKKMSATTTPCKTLSKSVQKSQWSAHSEQAAQPMEGRETISAEPSTEKDWDFLDHIPQSHAKQEGHSHFPSFRKLYKKPTPLGIWIHACIFDM